VHSPIFDSQKIKESIHTFPNSIELGMSGVVIAAFLQLPIELADGSQEGAKSATENSQQDHEEHAGVHVLEETCRGTPSNLASAFIGTNMSHAAYGPLTTLAAEGVAASLTENDRDFVWMAEAVHAMENPRGLLLCTIRATP
jgi:hypothetical protein